jgi:hypothetical protein
MATDRCTDDVPSDDEAPSRLHRAAVKRCGRSGAARKRLLERPATFDHPCGSAGAFKLLPPEQPFRPTPGADYVHGDSPTPSYRAHASRFIGAHPAQREGRDRQHRELVAAGGGVDGAIRRQPGDSQGASCSAAARPAPPRRRATVSRRTLSHRWPDLARRDSGEDAASSRATALILRSHPSSSAARSPSHDLDRRVRLPARPRRRTPFATADELERRRSSTR